MTHRKKNKPDTGGCAGLCCSMFNLDGDTAEDYYADWVNDGDEEGRFVYDMLIHIGEDDNDWPVYTCKHWDKLTKLCTMYEQRPSMCRTYPDGEPCTWEGCSVKG